ncbi:AAA family ATPase, partial [Rhodoblastus sp.]|uniref:AAA family ATPase n=1 Tax=Rhodoblastus sp. TaxID=1962975 RepID=UPI0035B3FE0B
MRLLDLTLDRYGPFDGLRLVFDPDASVHIVYGPNEAGKSSALAALGDLFYGAPRREKISFLRPKELRLGATLRGRNGQILQFFRRRGDRNTLLDPSGAALPEDALAPFLGAATRDIFHRAFGLNAASLRAGGDDMLRAEGEIGATLFAAASGLRGLIDLRAGLEAEAEQIFDDRRASHRAFYQALDRFDAARAQERAALVSESALKALGETIESAGEQLSAIEREDSEAQAEALRLERLCKAAPILARLARLRAEAALHDDLASISAEAAQGFVALLAARDAALQQAEQARETREAARREMEAAAPDAALLAEADPIDDLIRASGAYEKAAADLPRREQALREARQMLFARAQTCGLAGVEALRAALPDAATLLRAEKLAARGRELLALRDDPARALAEEKSRLGAADAAPRDDLPEADVLREKLHAFGEIETLDASWRDLSRACAANARALEEKRGRLSPALADAERFARSPSPDAAAIERAARAFEDFSAREAKARLKAQEAGERLVAARARLHNLERQGPIASLTSLREARDRRDRAWLDLRALVADETPAAPERLRDRALLFEALAADADRNADALLANAAQAAAAEGEREAIEAAQVEQDGAAATLDALTLEHGRL